MASLLLINGTNVMSQKLFTLEDLNFGGKNYHNMTPERWFLTWWGNRLVRLDVDDCRIVDVLTGDEETLITTDEINRLIGATADSIKVHHLYYATFPYADEPLILVSTQAERLLIDFKKHTIAWRQPCNDESHSDWTAPTRAVAFIRNDQLCVTDSAGLTRQITTDGSREIVYGQAVHRNEFGIEKGTFWSNDGQMLAFYRMDQSMVTDYPLVNTYTDIAEYAPEKYPMAGTASHKVQVGIYNLLTGDTLYLKTGDPTDRYFTNITWSPDAKTVYMQELNRDQNDARLVSYDAQTGEMTGVIYEERNAKYVEPLHPLTFLPWDSGKFIMHSQRDGWNHLYLFDLSTARDGETRQTSFGSEYNEYVDVKQLTTGDFTVQDIIGINKTTKSILILSTEKSPLQSNIYSVNVKTGRRVCLDDGKGVHSATACSDGSMLYDTYSEPDVPRNIDVINTSKDSRSRLLTAADPWQGYTVPIFTTGTIKAADGTTDLYYRMVKPADFDASKKYPVVVYVYGGPHAQMITNSWHYQSRSWDTYMAQNGFIVFTIDNRGSSNRGLAFEQSTFRKLGQVEAEDQMKGVEYLLSLPYIDKDRIGVHGWSYGGFMTITLMTSHPDIFKVGVAGGPVIDWRWYEVMYGERYMDTPQSNPEGYDAASLIDKAVNLKGKLQIIIGMNDPTVLPQNTLRFIEACTEAGTQPDLFVYPGEGHNMMGHKSVHLHERITQYFIDNL